MSAKLVGDQQFDLWRGRIPTLKTRLDVWVVPGIDGPGAQDLAYGDAEAQLQASAFFYGGSAESNSSDADDFLDACEALQGTLQDIFDAWGRSYSNVLIKKVECDKIATAIFNDNSAVRVNCNLLVEATE